LWADTPGVSTLRSEDSRQDYPASLRRGSNRDRASMTSSVAHASVAGVCRRID